MTDYETMLWHFHEKYGHPKRARPGVISSEENLVRLSLMVEELGELADAMRRVDIVEIADGLADLLYVVFGTAVAYGIPIGLIFDAVHNANMSKPREKIAGKTIKDELFVRPNNEIAKILADCGWHL